MASQDETPTHRPTTPGEPGDADVPQAGSRIGSRTGAHSARAAGAGELPDDDGHADWDAAFSGLAGTAPTAGGTGRDEGAGRTGEPDADGGAADHLPDAAAAEPETDADAAVTDGAPTEAADAVATDTGATDTEAAASGASERTEPAEPAEPGTSGNEARVTDVPVTVAPVGDGPVSDVPVGNATAGGDAADDRGDAGDHRPAGAAAAAGTVPGGHPSVAQRSDLPMRPASTMPDVSSYAAAGGPDAGPADAANAAAAGNAATAYGTTDDAAANDRGVAAAGSAADRDDSDPVRQADGDADGSEAPAEDSPSEVERRAREREKAAAGKPVLARVLQVMIAVFFPVVVLAAAIRAVATPLFLWVEYHRPGFPQDSYGFSSEDRMTYGSYAVDYLSNFAGARYLGDLVGDGGEPLYLESEVSHMADVKTVLTVAFAAAAVMLVLGICAGIYLRRRSPGGIRRALFAGAVLTLSLMAVLVVLAVLGWEQFFTQVHTIFFANGNWTFRLDDTLIRLFPAQFWMDAGIVVAALVLAACAVTAACTWPTKARRERVRQAREDARLRYAESLNAL